MMVDLLQSRLVRSERMVGLLGQQREVSDIKVWKLWVEYSRQKPGLYSSSSVTIYYSFYIFKKYVADCVMVNETDMLPIFMGFIMESDIVNTKYINSNCDAYCGRKEQDTMRESYDVLIWKGGQEGTQER